MAFTKSYRLERVYFERLKSMIDILKPYLNEETDEKLRAILENSIDDNGAILLLYRNLGECWAELSDLIKKADEKIDQTKEDAEKYHDELNKRIDEVNNYIMGIIRLLEETKQDKLTPLDGIEISEENEIRASVFDMQTATNITNELRAFCSRTTEQISNQAGGTIPGIEETIKITATGAQLKSILSNYNMLQVSMSTAIALPTLNSLLNEGDLFELHRSRYTCPTEFITSFFWFSFIDGTPKINGTVSSYPLRTRFNIEGLQSLLRRLVDETEYKFEWKFAYFVYVNGQRILDGNNGLLNPDNYSNSLPTIYGLN